MKDFDIHDIGSLSAEEIADILKLEELRKEAQSCYGIIHKNIKFSIGEDKIKLWDDTNNAEYITHSGVWQARYLHQTYDVICTIEGIFDVFKAEYFKSKRHDCKVNNTADSARYFRSFCGGLGNK